nr:Arc family DNA-binding protein [Pseudomonas sp. MWU13-3659]
MTITFTNSRTADKFVIRLPDGMRERLAGVARARLRSMNSEIVARLAKSIDAEDTENQTGSITIYLPDAVTTEIADLARTNERSVNGEITYRLKRSAVTDQLNDEQARMIGILQRRIEELESQVQLKGAA